MVSKCGSAPREKQTATLGFRTSVQAVSIRVCLVKASKSFVKDQNTNDHTTAVCLDLIGFVGQSKKPEKEQKLASLLSFLDRIAKYDVMKDVFHNTSLSPRFLPKVQRLRW